LSARLWYCAAAAAAAAATAHEDDISIAAVYFLLMFYYSMLGGRRRRQQHACGYCGFNCLSATDCAESEVIHSFTHMTTAMAMDGGTISSKPDSVTGGRAEEFGTLQLINFRTISMRF
jgi:hypothetical protein